MCGAVINDELLEIIIKVLIQVIYRWMLIYTRQQLALLVSVNMCCPQDCFVLVAVADCTQV